MRNTCNRIISHPVETFLCLLMTSLCVVVFTQVLARYIFEAPLTWSEEAARFLLMWLVMMSAAFAFKKNAHFAVRFAADRMPPPIQRAITNTANLITILFIALFFVASILMVINSLGYTAPALKISMAIPYSSTIAGSALMLFYVCKSAWQEWIRPKD